ncbi:MAG: alpha/beta family hydrolase [Gemmatimonadota bacterium]
MGEISLTIECGHDRGPVSGLLVSAHDARALFVFGHGAGAGLRHPFMEAVASRLSASGVSSLRYQFPYMESGRRAPDARPVLVETVRAAVRDAVGLSAGLPVVAGGKSMGGRMTSTAAAEACLPGVRGLAFFGFPLHAAGRDSSERGTHLAEVGLPMLFLQGTRDRLANLELLRPVLDVVEPPPTLHVLDGADHGFHVLKRSGRTDDAVLDEACGAFVSWVERFD